MKLNLKTLVILAMAMFIVACGSMDDGTQVIQEIQNVSQSDVDAGIYSGKFRVEMKNRDGYTDWIYTDVEYTVGDSLSLISMSHLSDLQTAVEASQATAAIQDSIVNALRGVVSALEGQLAEAVNFKTQVKALLVEVEAKETAPAATVETDFPRKEEVIVPATAQISITKE